MALTMRRERRVGGESFSLVLSSHSVVRGEKRANLCENRILGSAQAATAALLLVVDCALQRPASPARARKLYFFG
jgi:hypothetical protein